MSSISGYECHVCHQRHPQKAFISHAGKDAEITKEAAKACCATHVAPYLFEYSPEFSQPAIDNARTIANEIGNSDVFLVVLSPSVSEAFWTQAWIGFEIGVSIGSAIASENLGTGDYFSGRIIVLQDVRQEIKVSVPRVDILFLFDFSRTWDDTQDLLKFISAYMSEPSDQFFQIANKLRARMMTGKATCENATCKGVYNVVLPIKHADRLGFSVWWNGIQRKRIQWIEKGLQAICALKCPSCGQKVNCELTRSL